MPGAHRSGLFYGEHLGGNASNVETNDYLYGGKELQKKFGINLYDSQARFQANTGMFLSLDPLAEKFYGISPYSYCAGNPVNLVDQGGDTIHVAAEDQGLVLKILEKVFDKFASGFKFNKEGNLEYTGTTKGMGKEQRFKETSIQINDCDLFFHELGHVIYAGQTQDKVIKYNNYVRKILNLPKRRMDETHNPNVKNSLYD